MGRRRLAVLLGIVITGVTVLVGRAVAPARYDSVVSNLDPVLNELPRPVVLAIVTIGLLVVWGAAMILLGKAVYLAWRQIDDYVFWAMDLVLPESPIIRFGVGVIVMMFLFIFGPLFILQSTDFLEGEDENVEESLDDNTTTPDNETGTNESSAVRSLSDDSVELDLSTADEGYALLTGSSGPDDTGRQGRIRPT